MLYLCNMGDNINITPGKDADKFEIILEDGWCGILYEGKKYKIISDPKVVDGDFVYDIEEVKDNDNEPYILRQDTPLMVKDPKKCMMIKPKDFKEDDS